MKPLLVATAVGLLIGTTSVGRVSGGTLLVILLIAVILIATVRSGGARATQAHFHGNGPRVRLHEGAHLSAARQTGAPVAQTRLGNNPMVRLAAPEQMSSRDYMAFMMAGEAATGSVGTSHDRANVRAEQRRMRDRGTPAAEVRQVTRAARSDARRYARRAAYWADRL